MGENRAAADQLSLIDIKSTRHMEHDERADGIEVMLDDLHLLATRDGCIAAAWAWEILTTMAKHPGWLQQMPGRR